MKWLGIIFLISAVFIGLIILIVKFFLNRETGLQFKYERTIVKLNQKLEELKDNETKAIRIKNWSNDTIKAEYEKKLKEILEEIDAETRCYDNPVIAINNIHSKIIKIGGGDKYEGIKKDIS